MVTECPDVQSIFGCSRPQHSPKSVHLCPEAVRREGRTRQLPSQDPRQPPLLEPCSGNQGEYTLTDVRVSGRHGESEPSPEGDQIKHPPSPLQREIIDKLHQENRLNHVLGLQTNYLPEGALYAPRLPDPLPLSSFQTPLRSSPSSASSPPSPSSSSSPSS